MVEHSIHLHIWRLLNLYADGVPVCLFRNWRPSRVVAREFLALVSSPIAVVLVLSAFVIISPEIVVLAPKAARQKLQSIYCGLQRRRGFRV